MERGARKGLRGGSSIKKGWGKKPGRIYTESKKAKRI